MQYVEICLRCLVGVVFVVSSISKVAGAGAFEEFVRSVYNVRLLPAHLIRPAALLVVVAEFAVWALLATPTLPSILAGFVMAAGLLLGFTVVVGVSLHRGDRQPCRCFGASTAPLGHRHLVRNIVLVVAAVVGTMAALTTGTAQASGAIVAVLGGLLVGGLFIVLDDILELFQPINAAAESDRGQP